ncbi:hypothetical protein MVEN_01796500 [Mycena venus]|uniref:Uncharacterized protein n=1 Tax=Mycena venus TaxID=2733690 RepID=A0A8H6XJA6_9AGAR|nr:hypothetical protein MVEN_01796500 [Mycena venus]
MYPDGRTNPAPAHFARNTPVEIHPPVSPRLLQQRHLDREGRAICRIVYSHGIGIEIIAGVFCISEDIVIQAIENKPTDKTHDKAENDYWYVSAEYRNQYPPLPKPGYHETSNRDVKESQSENGEPNVTERSENAKAQSPGCRKERGGTHHSNPGTAVFVPNPTARHFKDNKPVSLHKISGKLDRKGRAICRIMHPYLENYTKIATIFGTTRHRVREAVLNDLSPPDNVAEDYAYAGKEFKNEFPPLPKKDQHDSAKRPKSPELDEIPQKRAKNDEIASAVIVKVPRQIPVVELPARPKVDPDAAAIRRFLKDIGGFDLSHWQETFRDKGLHTMGDLTTLARLEESKLLKTLTKLFAGKKMAEVHIVLLADALMDLAKDV